MRDSKALLELIRIPGVFTAHADILAGALIAGVGIQQVPELVLLLVASSCFFSAGMALNDYFDRDIDKQERPTRPIPSGRVAQGTALSLGIALLAAGVAVTFFVNAGSFIIALLMTVAILLYDGRLKKLRWVGPFNMGFCRYLNMMLGLSILPLSPGVALIPSMTWLYIFGITVLSSSEVRGHDPFSVAICSASILGVAVVFYLFFAMGLLQNNTGLYFCLVWLGIAGSLSLRLFFKTSPGEYQKTIRWLLLLLVVLDGGIVSGARSVVAAMLVFPLIFPGGYIAKRYYVT